MTPMSNSNNSTPIKQQPQPTHQPKPSSNSASTPTASNASSTAGDYGQYEDAGSNEDGSESEYLNSSSLPPGLTATAAPIPDVNNPLNANNFLSMDHTEAMQHLEKALSSCEATLTETPGHVKMEPDDHHQLLASLRDKPFTINPVPPGTCAPGSPFPAMEGKPVIIYFYNFNIFTKLLIQLII